MAKAAYWTVTDVEARKRGEQTGLDPARDLAAAGAVKKGGRVSIHGTAERRELIANIVHVKLEVLHTTNSPFWFCGAELFKSRPPLSVSTIP